MSVTSCWVACNGRRIIWFIIKDNACNNIEITVIDFSLNLGNTRCDNQNITAWQYCAVIWLFIITSNVKGIWCLCIKVCICSPSFCTWRCDDLINENSLQDFLSGDMNKLIINELGINILLYEHITKISWHLKDWCRCKHLPMLNCKQNVICGPIRALCMGYIIQNDCIHLKWISRVSHG